MLYRGRVEGEFRGPIIHKKRCFWNALSELLRKGSIIVAGEEMEAGCLQGGTQKKPLGRRGRGSRRGL